MFVKINRCPYEQNKKMFKIDTLEVKPGLTVLIGRNGLGKTTMLQQIKMYCKDNDIPVYHYDNYKEGGATATSNYGFFGDMLSMASTLFKSEGEQIFFNLGKTLEKIANFHTKNVGKECVVLLDALDSGLDVEGLTQLINLINDICANNNKAYFILTANNYALIHENACMDVRTGQYIRFKDFIDYKDFILKQYRKSKSK